MRPTNLWKVTLCKISTLILTFTLFLIAGISISNSSRQNLKNNISLNNSLNLVNSRALNIDSYIKNASLIANNYEIKVKLKLTLPWVDNIDNLVENFGNNTIGYSFDKTRIDMYRGDPNVCKTSDNYSYFNIGLHSNNVLNSDPGKLQQYINLISNGKYIWESGFSPNFNLMSRIVDYVISKPNLNLSNTLYLNFVQEGNGKYQKELVQHDYTNSWGNVIPGYWYVVNEAITLPQNGTITLKSITETYNPLTSVIQCTEQSQSSNKKTQVIKSNSGINFTLEINPKTAIVNSPDMNGECSLQEYLTWVREFSKNYNNDLINYGTPSSINDSIVIDQAARLNNLASGFYELNTVQIYKDSINDQLSRGQFNSQIWQVSDVLDLDDSKLSSEVSSIVNQIVADKKLKPFDDATGIFYKVIKLDNAFYLGKEARVNPSVPWLYYLCDVANEPLASYYIIRFEAIKKIYSLSSLNYDFSSKQFYIDTNNVNFNNLKQQNFNWPSRIYLTYDLNQWINNFNSNLNSISSISLPLNFENNQGIPFLFDFTNQVVTPSLYNGFVDFFAANGIDLNSYGINSANNINATTTTNSINFSLSLNPDANDTKIAGLDVITFSLIGVLVGVVLIGAIIGGTFALTNRKKTNKNNLIVNARPTTSTIVKPKKPVIAPTKANLIILNKQNASFSKVGDSQKLTPIPKSILYQPKKKIKLTTKIASKFKEIKEKINLPIKKKKS